MFEKLIGNEQVKKTLIDAINSENVSHSYIFSGIEGIGKRQFAKEFVKNIMCIENGKCEEKCDSCIKINANSNPDYTEIEPDGKTIKIDQIRNMQEKVAEKPIISNKKAYIINDADLMSEESQNCLLKTLEEPPKYTIIILVVSNENKLLPTIKSRCVSVKFNKISDEEIKKHINNISNEQIKLLGGSLKNIENIQEKEEEYNAILKVVETLQKGQLLDLLENADILYTNKDNILELLDYLNVILLEKRIIDPIIIVEETKHKIISNNNYEMSIDNMLIKCWKSIH